MFIILKKTLKNRSSNLATNSKTDISKGIKYDNRQINKIIDYNINAGYYSEHLSAINYGIETV